MNLAQAVDIGCIGEQVVVSHLTRKGWTDIKLNARGPSATDIQAKNPKGVVHLFQVKTAASPHTPDDVSNTEKAAIKSRAQRIGAAAFAAKVQLSTNYAVVTIDYVPL
jgi:Holliday junction resolvase-like predicted endonuclease